MNQPPFNLGILGLGEGVSILSAAMTTACAEPYLLCDLNEDLCKKRAKEYGLTRYTTSYEDMLADPVVDGVAIYTPDPLHGEHVRMALEAGKHVICTKPLFKGLDEAKAVYDLWRDSRLAVMVGMSCRFFETFVRQRQMADEDRHGNLLSVEAHYNGDKRQGSSGAWGKAGAVDWLYAGLVHPVDLAYWHLGPIQEVSGFGMQSPAAKRQGQTTPDTLHFVVKSAAGVVGRITGCYGAPCEHPDGAPLISCTLRGDSGVSQACYPEFKIHSHFDGSDPATLICDRHSYYFRWGGTMHHAGEFQNYLEHFVESIRARNRPKPDLVDGIRVVATLDAMKRALAENRVVSVADELERCGLGELAGEESRVNTTQKALVGPM